LEQFERAIELYQESLAITCEVSNRRGASFPLLGLGQALLANGALAEARQDCEKSVALDVPAASYRAALMLAIVLLQQQDPSAREAFADAAARCRTMLEKTPGLYKVRYALAAVLVGSAVCDPSWDEESQRTKLLEPALREYRQLLKACTVPGITRTAFHDVKMIQRAGVDGLEPVFELLEREATAFVPATRKLDELKTSVS
jgi:tetratricopeptide (TPR) repeat protein